MSPVKQKRPSPPPLPPFRKLALRSQRKTTILRTTPPRREARSSYLGARPGPAWPGQASTRKERGNHISVTSFWYKSTRVEDRASHNLGKKDSAQKLARRDKAPAVPSSCVPRSCMHVRLLSFPLPFPLLTQLLTSWVSPLLLFNLFSYLRLSYDLSPPLFYSSPFSLSSPSSLLSPPHLPVFSKRVPNGRDSRKKEKGKKRTKHDRQRGEEWGREGTRRGERIDGEETEVGIPVCTIGAILPKARQPTATRRGVLA